MALTSPSLKLVDLRVFADEELARELSVVPGVAAVDVSGGVEEEVQVTVDLDRLQSAGVGLNTVLTELGDRNQDISGGRIYGDNSEPLTRAVGKFQTAKELRDLSFEVGRGSGGRRVRQPPLDNRLLDNPLLGNRISGCICEILPM